MVAAGFPTQEFIAPEQDVERSEPGGFLKEADVLRSYILEAAGDNGVFCALAHDGLILTLTLNAPGTGSCEMT